MKISLALQGPVYPYTTDIVADYLKHPLVDEVVISCWTTCPELGIKDSRIRYIRNEDPAYPGIGNVNRQLITSLAGIKAVTNEYCAKMRTDQWISLQSLSIMHDFFSKFKIPEIHFLDGTGPTANIFVLGMYTRFAFHPRDHVYWGNKADILKLLDIPLCMHSKEVPGFVTGTDEYFEHVVRPETYIGAHYYAHFDKAVLSFLEDHQKYLTDVSPCREEALMVYHNLRDKVFKVFPRIEMSWPKHNLKSYHYEVGERFSEYWYEKSW